MEVERWCGDPECNARTRLSLTKDEARAYTGFECERCERRRADALTERDIPDWWEELKITSLEGVRMGETGETDTEDRSGTVARLSEAWERLRGDEDSKADARETEDRF